MSEEFELIFSEADKLCFEQGKYVNAMQMYKKALKKFPDSSILLSRRANLYRLSEKWHYALNDVNRALEIDPENSYALYTKVRILCSLNCQDAALHLFNSQSFFLNEAKQTLQQRAAAACSLGMYVISIQECNNLLREYPDDPSILYTRGVAEFYSNQYEKSIETLKSTLKQRKNHMLSKQYINKAEILLGV